MHETVAKSENPFKCLPAHITLRAGDIASRAAGAPSVWRLGGTKDSSEVSRFVRNLADIAKMPGGFVCDF